MQTDADGNIISTDLGQVLKKVFVQFNNFTENAMTQGDFINQMKNRNSDIYRVVTKQAEQYITTYFRKELRKIG